MHASSKLTGCVADQAGKIPAFSLAMIYSPGGEMRTNDMQ